VLYPGSTGLKLDKSSIRSRLPRRPRYRSSGAVIASASRLNVQIFTNGGVTPNFLKWAEPEVFDL
jgi:hypothetical protein